MGKTLDLSDEERKQVDQGIENFFEFVKEILDDPTILEGIPNGANVKAIPKDQ